MDVTDFSPDVGGGRSLDVRGHPSLAVAAFGKILDGLTAVEEARPMASEQDRGAAQIDTDLIR